jgi:hypothetical protein
MNAEVPGLLGCLIPPWPSPFPTDLRGISTDIVPHTLASMGSSSQTLRLYYRVLPTCHRPAMPKHNRHASSGFAPLRDIHNQSPPLDGFQHHLRSALAVSHDLDGLLLLLLVGLFHPTATCRIHVPGVSPPTQPNLTHRQAVPSCR